MDLVFKNVSVEIGETKILHHVSGLAKQGQMIAIMGPSGAGKSTLLTALAGRKDLSEGSVMLNDQPLTKDLKRKICYVMQTDIFFSTLTLMETLSYTALLRLPDKMPVEMKKQRVEDVIEALNLDRCRNTPMGGVDVPGLSGGEKKRATIACELLPNPHVLLLDEPTSGLDAAIAYTVMDIMREFAKKHQKTIAASIHQPNSQIFYMFDYILLMAAGKLVYFGSPDNIIVFFSSIGLQCQPHYNPADFVMEKTKDPDESDEIALRFKDKKHQYLPEELLVDDEEILTTRRRGSILDLFKRTKKSPSATSFTKEQQQLALAKRRQSAPVIFDRATNAPRVRFAMDAESANPPMVKISSVMDFNDVGKGQPLTPIGEDNRGLSMEDEDDDSEAAVTTFQIKPPKDEEASIGSHENGDVSSVKDTAIDVEKKEEVDVSQYFDENAKWQTGFWTQFTVLTVRALLLAKHRILSKVNLVRVFVMAILAGIFWFRLPRAEDTINDRLGVIFFFTTFWAFQPLFDAILSFPAEREIIKRERASGAYRLSTYYLAKMCSEIPVTLAMPAAFHVVVYWMSGMNATVGGFLQSLGLLLLHSVNAQSLGIFIGIAVDDFQNSITVGAIVTLAAYLTAGYLQRSMPGWIAWVGYFSFVRYSFHSMVVTEFAANQNFRCSPANTTMFPTCLTSNTSYVTGTEILEAFEMVSPLWIDIVVMFGYIVFFRCLGYLFLRYIKNPNAHFMCLM